MRVVVEVCVFVVSSSVIHLKSLMKLNCLRQLITQW